MIKYSQYPIGLDISDLSLKFVQLEKSGDKILMHAFSKIDVPRGVIEDGQIKNSEEFVKIVKKMLDKPIFGKTVSNEAVVCLPEAQTFIKLLKIYNSSNKLKTEIESELANFVPIEIEDLYFDYQVIFNNDEYSYVLVGASPKTFVDEYVEILKEAKISVVATEIESVAISRAILYEESATIKDIDRKNYIIIDIGANRTSVFVYSKDTILFDISIPISGDSITKKIAKSLKLDKEQSELAKITIGLDKKRAGGVIEKALSEMIDKLVGKIKNVLDFHESHFEEFGPIDHIFVCGGGANIKDLDKMLEKNLNIPTSIGNPLINIYNSKKLVEEKFLETYKLSIGSTKTKKTNNSISITQDGSVNYTTAIGLGLRSLFLE